MKKDNKVGAVLVVGAGIGGVQASLDLADSGYKVYLMDKQSAIGGTMAQLDKTFPTNDCSMCILAPKLVDAGRHENIEVVTLSEVEALMESRAILRFVSEEDQGTSMKQSVRVVAPAGVTVQ